jgi:SulP family sulfate permease
MLTKLIPFLSWNKALPFLGWKDEITRVTLRHDLLAGTVGAAAVLPQAVAFATIAGLPPQYGLYAAVVPAIIAALFGSSKHLVSGPTTAISLVVFASLAPFAAPGTAEYISLALTLALLVGLFELVFGMMRLGVLLNFISHTVIVGFTAGAAILIAASQIKNFFGIAIPQGAHFSETIHIFFMHLGEINPFITAVAIVTLITGILFRRFFSKIPYMLPAILIGSLFGLILNHFFSPDITHLKTVGALPASLPPLSMPDLSWHSISELFSPALAITLLALTEAAAIAHAIALRSSQRVKTNQEFVGQGLSNILGSFFSAYPSSGSFNRSGLNFEAGAKTPLASVFAAIILCLIVLFVMPLAAYLPIAVMAGILFLVAWGLIDYHHISKIRKTSPREFALLITTFLATLFLDLEFAIFVGAFFSIALYLQRSSQPTVLTYLPDPTHEKRRFSSAAHLTRCPQLSIVRIEGPLFFGSVANTEDMLRDINERYPDEKHLLIVADSMPLIDLAGAEMLLREKKSREQAGGSLSLSNLRGTVRDRLKKSGFLRKLGKDRIFESKSDAIESIIKKLDHDICRNCPHRIFQECQ